MSLKYIGYSTRFGSLGVREHPLPTNLKPNQLLVDVSYVGINPIDIKLKSIAFIPMRWSVGKDFSGVIEQVGSAQLKNWSIGDRVCGGLLSPVDGILGTKAIFDVTKHALVKVPPNLSDAQASAFPLTYGTAFSMLERTGGKGKLLVLGGRSNVGCYVIQLAKKMYKFDTVVATCSRESFEFVKSLGASEAVDYKSADVSKQLKDLNIKFDAIVDTVGGYDALAVWPDILLPHSQGGVYVSNSGDIAPSGSYKHALVMPTLLTIPWAVPRLLFGRYMGINYQLVAIKDNKWTKTVNEFFSRDDVHIPIDSEHNLEEYQKAWKRLENMQAKGKVLLKMRD